MSNSLEAAAAWASSGKIPTTQAEVETLKSLCKAVNGLLLKLRRLKNAPSAKRASARWSIEEDAELRVRCGFVKGGRVGAVAALAGRRSAEACLSHLNKVLLPSVMDDAKLQALSAQYGQTPDELRRAVDPLHFPAPPSST